MTTPKPLSLNERNERLLGDLSSQTRPVKILPTQAPSGNPYVLSISKSSVFFFLPLLNPFRSPSRAETRQGKTRRPSPPLQAPIGSPSRTLQRRSDGLILTRSSDPRYPQRSQLAPRNPLHREEKPRQNPLFFVLPLVGFRFLALEDGT